MLSNLYRFASLRKGVIAAPRLAGSAVGPNPARATLAILVICGLGIMTGSAAGAGIKLLGSKDEKPAGATVAAKAEPKPKVEVQAPVLTVADPQIVAAPAAPVLVVAPPKPAPAPKPKPVVKAPVAAPAPAPAPVPQVVQPAARCAANQVMDDGKIYWLLDQSAKALAENPSQAAGAARVDADLRSALGKNLCAAEAQALIASTCTDAAAVKFLNTMVSRLPFFIEAMVGNPCTADLVAVLNKMGKFIT